MAVGIYNEYCKECRAGKGFYKAGSLVKYDPEEFHTPDAESCHHPEMISQVRNHSTVSKPWG